GASGSSTMSARLLAFDGTPDQVRAGETFPPRREWRYGVMSPCFKMGLNSCIEASSCEGQQTVWHGGLVGSLAGTVGFEIAVCRIWTAKNAYDWTACSLNLWWPRTKPKRISDATSSRIKEWPASGTWMNTILCAGSSKCLSTSGIAPTRPWSSTEDSTA